MSNTMPVSLVFDLQRNAIEQTQQTFKRSLDAQRKFAEAVMDFGPAKQVHDHTTTATRRALDVYFDAIEATIPGATAPLADVRSTIDEQLDTLEDTQSEAIETVESNMQSGTESLEDPFEGFVDALDEQMERLLAAHEDVEARTVEAFDGYEGSIEDLRSEFESQNQVAREGVEAQLELFETQMAEMLRQLETVTETVAQVADTQVAAQVDAVDATSDSLEAINGLGPTYAERLLEVGIESIEALAEANADAVAEAADVTEKKAAEWIDAAQTWN